MDACYSLNRKKNYMTIYNNQSRYPLDMVQELKAQNRQTYQEIADALLKMENAE